MPATPAHLWAHERASTCAWWAQKAAAKATELLQMGLVSSAKAMAKQAADLAQEAAQAASEAGPYAAAAELDAARAGVAVLGMILSSGN